MISINMWYTESSNANRTGMPDVEYKDPPKYSEIAGDNNDMWGKSPATTEKTKPPPTVNKEAMEAEIMSWRKLIYDYSQSTTIHGVRYIAEDSVFVMRKVLWFFMVGTAFSFFVYYLVNRFDYFLQFKTNVNVEVNYRDQVKFPVVTFCNQNAFRITPVAKKNWYNTVKAMTASSTNPSQLRKCGETEHECVSDKKCIPRSRTCDIFPDCMDNSDEQNCEKCPLVTFKTDFEDSLPQMLKDSLGLKFEEQPNTFNDSSAVYITREQPFLYLYAKDGFWHISESHEDSGGLAKIQHSAPLPQDISDKASNASAVPGTWDNWQINLNGIWQTDSTFAIVCAYAFLDLLKEEDTTVLGDLSLEELYLEASHQQEDFIQSCKWKGQPCEEGAIRKTRTDMGICYTFNNTEMFIEQSGPGNGLSLTINIEQYEYTKSTEDGIGIKLLMHEMTDVPMMQDRGQAVSPGLSSFISIETTEVVNLESPWGDCGEKDLTYFDTYTDTRCIADCETVNVNDKCNCRLNMMPSDVNDEPPVCNVGQFIDCATPRLNEIRAAGNFCSDCPSPCVTEEYVPTTSFSVILGGDGNFQDEKTYILQQKLFEAREVTFRVVKEKNMATMRIFHIMNQQMLWMKKFVEYINGDMEKEYDHATTHAIQVKADCVWMRNMSQEARTTVDHDVLIPLQDFKSVMLTRTKDAFVEIETLVDGMINVVDDALTAYGEPWPLRMHNDPMHSDYMRQYDDYVNRTIQRNNITLWQTATRLIASLEQIRDEIHVDMETQLSSLNISAFAQFALNKTLLDPIRPDIGTHCAWCVETEPRAILDILKTRVIEKVGVIINSRLTDVINNVQDSLNAYLSYDWVKMYWKWNLYPIQQTTLTNMRDSTKAAYSDIDDTIHMIQDAIDDTKEVLSLIDDLVSYAWGLQCQTKLPKLLNEYNGNKVVTAEMLDSLYKYLEDQDHHIYAYQRNYTDRHITLEFVGGAIKFEEISNNVHGLKLRLDSSINDRALLLDDIEKQINQIYYVIMAQVGGAVSLKTTSKYWQAFSITTPDAKLPTPKLINGVELPLLDYTMITDGQDAGYWGSLIDALETHQKFLQIQLDSLDSNLFTAKDYFATYIAANQINTDFYSKNFLNVELFYKELTENKVSQQKAYEYQNLLSELGGLMGLLLGASVLTIGEIADLFIYNAFRKCLRSKVKPMGQ